MYIYQNCCICNDKPKFSIYDRKKQVIRYCESCFKKHKVSIMIKISRKEIKSATENTSEKLSEWFLENSKIKNESKCIVDQSDWEKKRQKIEALLLPFVGMDNVKETILSWADRLQGEERVRSQAKIKLKKSCFHMTITGSTGVGKSEIARVIAKAMYILGVVESDTFVETNRDGLIGEHVGATGPKTKKVIEGARSGVLFIDEAPTIATDYTTTEKTNFGKEAVTTLMDALEKERGRTVFIFAGYPVDMESFLRSNQGLVSRIPLSIHINDYTPKEITDIILLNLHQQGFGTGEVRSEIEKAVQRKSDKGIIPGNARAARSMSEEILSNYFKRVIKEEGEIKPNILPVDVSSFLNNKISKQDEEGFENVKENALKQLYALSGLTNIKKQIQKIGAYEYVQRKKEEKGMPTNRSTLHMTFNGNPGTGKTTVARILGTYFRGMGILSRGHFTEISKADLVRGSEPTASTVKNIVKRAIGGVLFVDEAYALAREKQGVEALDTLIKEMEDHREDLIVIMAGYSKEMESLYQVNPGLHSRIAYHLEFEDYDAKDLIQILNDLLGSQGLKLTQKAGGTLISFVEEFHKKGWIQSNGRWARNVFEKIMMSQSLRIVEEASDDYDVIEYKDIVESFDEMPKQKGDSNDAETKKKKITDMIKRLHALQI